ncbi:Protein phosphatase methylesterase 1 [Ceratocystis lukuohia]|uniref:Protein phosphatase methylesterase 1 n=2 Tax=Ceratocystis TaxID=5157 RepID=A0A2C5X4R1_9PEZI|nr:Protein phosphatase methylesterase 1 [Ceratocystis fimbriata CBS 114723]
MSELQKHWAKAKLAQQAGLEPNLPSYEEEAEDEVAELGDGEVTETEQTTADDDSSSASSASSTGTVIPSPGRGLFARTIGPPRGRSIDPIPWTTYFERELTLDLPTANMHAYFNPPGEKGPLFVMHHGAGSSGLSFAVLSAEIQKLLPHAGTLCPDARGHGSTTDKLSPTGPPDLSLPRLAQDLLDTIHATKAAMGWMTLPPIILIGHSLGGAVVTHVALGTKAEGPTPGMGLQQALGAEALLGFAVLDVVEGSAMEALQSMTAYLSTRPTGFTTVAQAIDWHVRSRTLRNSVSARSSVPGLLRRDEAEDTARPWRWRTDLQATQPFWEGWYKGLSGKFLAAKGGKLLLLAGTDRLDTELTIGQMQGKYALQVFPDAGHFIQEDVPEKTAMVLVDFYKRNDRSLMVLPPKVSSMPKKSSNA